MPIIHKIEKPPEKELILVNFAQQQRYEKYLRAKNLHNYMFYCCCLHPEHNHHEFNNYICSYSGIYCNCTGLQAINLNFRVIITEIDLFEFEVKDHSERDSLSYYSELNLWRISKECE